MTKYQYFVTARLKNISHLKLAPIRTRYTHSFFPLKSHWQVLPLKKRSYFRTFHPLRTCLASGSSNLSVFAGRKRARLFSLPNGHPRQPAHNEHLPRRIVIFLRTKLKKKSQAAASLQEAQRNYFQVISWFGWPSCFYRLGREDVMNCASVQFAKPLLLMRTFFSPALFPPACSPSHCARHCLEVIS